MCEYKCLGMCGLLSCFGNGDYGDIQNVTFTMQEGWVIKHACTKDSL